MESAKGMSKKEKPGLDEVRKYLEERGDGPDGLTTENFNPRPVETADPVYRDCVVFEVGRESYIRDSFQYCQNPVTLIVTNWSRYSFNPEDKTLAKLTNQSFPAILTDWAVLVESDVAKISFSFRLLGKGHSICLLYGPLGKEEWRIVNFDRVEQRIQDLSAKVRYEELAARIVCRAGTGNPVEVEKTLREEFCKGVVAKAWAKWVKYMEDPEEHSEGG